MLDPVFKWNQMFTEAPSAQLTLLFFKKLETKRLLNIFLQQIFASKIWSAPGRISFPPRLPAYSGSLLAFSYLKVTLNVRKWYGGIADSFSSSTIEIRSSARLQLPLRSRSETGNKGGTDPTEERIGHFAFSLATKRAWLEWRFGRVQADCRAPTAFLFQPLHRFQRLTTLF